MAAAVSYAEGDVAIFNVRLSDDLAGQFDSWAADHGGRSVALRNMVGRAVRDAKPPSARAGPRVALPVKLTVRLSADDAAGLASLAAETGLTRNAWAAAVLRRRLATQPTFVGADAIAVIAIQAELRRVGVNINQIARALNTAVLEGRVLDLELTYLDELRAEIRAHMSGLREAIAGNLAYWEGSS